jgi:hypothetical protein
MSTILTNAMIIIQMSFVDMVSSVGIPREAKKPM